MPEGPAILHLRNQLLAFKGKIIKDAGGYGKMKTDWMIGQKLLDIKTWGKHLLFGFKNGTVKVHLGLFGEILINEERESNPSFFMKFANGAVNGYVVRASLLEKPVEESYDWRTDILSPHFDKAYVKTLLKKKSNDTVDNILMDQDIFSGVGNKIRNEALFKAGIHPLSVVGKIPAAKVTKLINEVLKYAKLFYKNLEKKGSHDDFNVYKKEFTKDGSEITMKVLAKTKRKIYYSERNQELYK